MSVTKKGSAWEWQHSLWILWTFTVALNWVAFLYIGMRAKQPKWTIAGLVYAVPFVLLFALDKPSANSDMFAYAWTWDVVALVLLGVASILHAFVVRGEYLQGLIVQQEQQNEKYAKLKNLIKEEGTGTGGEATANGATAAGRASVLVAPPMGGSPRSTGESANSAIDLLPSDQTDSAVSPDAQISPASSSSEAESAELLATEEMKAVAESTPEAQQEASPPPAPRTVSQRVDEFVLHDPVESREEQEPETYSPTASVDLNIATADEIAGLPGFNLLLGMKAVSIREAQGKFKSIAHFVDVIGLKPHVAERIRPFVKL